MKFSLIIAVSVFLSSAAMAESVLVIGDSQSCEAQYPGVVGFGSTLARNLASQGNEVSLYCMVSSRPEHWLKGQRSGASCYRMTTPNYRATPCGGNGNVPTLTTLLNNFSGRRVVVALGSNSLLSGTADQYYKQMSQAIRARRKECEWIGPPHMDASKGVKPRTMERNLNGFYTSLVSAVGNECTVVNSRDATRPGSRGFPTIGGDPPGVHRTPAAGVAWANAIYPPVSARASSRASQSGAR